MSNAYALAMRDPAMAAIVGAIPSDNFGADFGRRKGTAVGADFGADEMGAFGDDLGADEVGAFGAASRPSPSQLHALWARESARKQHQNRREMLLDPNRGSSTKVERYTFSLNQAIVLGTVSTIQMTNQPDTTIRPQKVQMNAPAYGFVTLNEIKVANVSVTIGGISDAFEYNALATDNHLDMPTLNPSNKASILGSYTGFVPPAYAPAATYTFVASFKGPATVMG